MPGGPFFMPQAAQDAEDSGTRRPFARFVTLPTKRHARLFPACAPFPAKERFRSQQNLLSRRALSTTETEERDMAAPASMGDMAGPPKRSSTPAATGTRSTL